MFRLLLVSAFVALALGGSSRPRQAPLPNGRIVGGSDTTISDYPHQLSLEAYYRHSCGASLITPTKALTAAHCTDKRTADKLSIRGGTTVRTQGGQLVQVKSICQHPSYNPLTVDFDISVLTLAEPMKISSVIKTVELQPKNVDVPVGTVAAVSGWGRLDEGGVSPNILQVVELPRIADAKCNELYNRYGYKITQNMICFGYEEGGKDACQGDSGGPLVVDGVQVGVVSWGLGCARVGRPGVYSKVSALRDHVDTCTKE